MKKLENIRYSDKHTETLDVYLPDCADFRVIVLFHGGGLEKGDKVDVVIEGIGTLTNYMV